MLTISVPILYYLLEELKIIFLYFLLVIPKDVAQMQSCYFFKILQIAYIFPLLFVQVIALPLPHRPLFPGFYMPIYVKVNQFNIAWENLICLADRYLC